MIINYFGKHRLKTGLVRLSFVVGLFMLAQPFSGRGLAASPSSVFTVTNTNDSGPGSLRQAILDANANPGTDSVEFRIGSGAKTIAPIIGLPPITDPVIIDGTTQPGFGGRPIIQLSGQTAHGAAGLAITSGDSTIRGLVINRFSNAIILADKGNNAIETCFIGTDTTGTNAAQNDADGISLWHSSGNRIGGTSVAMRNVISGNEHAGIYINEGSDNNLVQGNFIGTNSNGTDRLLFPGQGGAPYRSSAGVNIWNAANNVIGGTEPGSRNVISGNHRGGIVIGGYYATGNLVQGNFIGTDAGGRYAVPNEADGVNISIARFNTIGGTEPGARNVISGNTFGSYGSGDGINLYDNGNGTATGGNVIRGNYIGVAADGITALPNTQTGIAIGNVSDAIVGGSEPGAGNIIAFNGGTGIGVGTNLSSPSRRDLISRNSIYSNGQLGIDIGAGGVTLNDASDADTGANNLQNYPVLTSANTSSGGTTVQGNLNSIPNTTFTLEFFVNSSCDSSGFGEGKSYLGSTQVQNWGNDSSIYVTFPSSVPVGQFITATAIDPSGSTSEFSQCIVVDGGPPTPPSIATPVLLPLEGSEEAITLESVTFLRAPFPVDTTNGFGGDGRTRVMLFASDVELLEDEGPSAVIAQAEDAQHQSYSLPVEFVGRVPKNDALTQLVVRLPEVFPIGDIRISITLHGKTSNQVMVRLRSP